MVSSISLYDPSWLGNSLIFLNRHVNFYNLAYSLRYLFLLNHINSFFVSSYNICDTNPSSFWTLFPPFAFWEVHKVPKFSYRLSHFWGIEEQVFGVDVQVSKNPKRVVVYKMDTAVYIQYTWIYRSKWKIQGWGKIQVFETQETELIWVVYTDIQQVYTNIGLEPKPKSAANLAQEGPKFDFSLTLLNYLIVIIYCLFLLTLALFDFGLNLIKLKDELYL